MIGTALACAVELLQLTPVPAQLSERFPPAALLVGSEFDLVDLALLLLGGIAATVALTARSADDGAMRRVHIIVTGKVQRVAFRNSMRRAAEQLGVAGWVRNRADGAVEAELEGDPDQVSELLAWAEHGPRHAQVAAVHAEDIDPTGDTGFEVR